MARKMTHHNQPQAMPSEAEKIEYKAIYGTGIMCQLHKADWLFCFCSTPKGGQVPLVNDGKAYL